MFLAHRDISDPEYYCRLAGEWTRKPRKPELYLGVYVRTRLLSGSMESSPLNDLQVPCLGHLGICGVLAVMERDASRPSGRNTKVRRPPTRLCLSTNRTQVPALVLFYRLFTLWRIVYSLSRRANTRNRFASRRLRSARALGETVTVPELTKIVRDALTCYLPSLNSYYRLESE